MELLKSVSINVPAADARKRGELLEMNRRDSALAPSLQCIEQRLMRRGKLWTMN
jgi:hypothetical protein